jgi:hypothetical protein
MTATQRIRSMLDGSPVKEIGACGWLHTIGADRDTAEVFSSAIIKMTDYSKWDFIKVMPNGVYNQEAHGSDIEYFSGPLSVEDLNADRFQRRRQKHDHAHDHGPEALRRRKDLLQWRGYHQ